MSLLTKAYDNLSQKRQRTVRDHIMEECGFSKETFYRKLRLPDSVSKTEQKVFAKKLGLPVDELFPVKKIASPKVLKTV